MNYDLVSKVQIDRELLKFALSDGGKEKCDLVAECFSKYPDVLDWIGALSGVGQPLTEPNASLELNEGKRQLFLQILSIIAIGEMSAEQIDAMKG